VTEPICVIFVGSTRPSDEWLRTQAKPLRVQPGRVRKALLWLKTHNRWYKDIIINEGLLNSLPGESTLPIHIEHVLPNQINESLTAGYDQSANGPDESHETGVTFESIVIADVDGDATVNELRAAAMCHIQKGGGYMEISHEANPVNKFFNPSMFPMIYPTLYPYGIGGFEDHRHATPVSMKRHVKH
ncbi:hypothetical protein EV368DRAFT_20905, partial [Lentinula lateritia]